MEVSVLGHFQLNSIVAIKDAIHFPLQVIPMEVLEIFCSKWPVPQYLLHKEYLIYGRNSKEWTINPDCF